MDWRIEEAEENEGDLEGIFAHLVASHLRFGQDPEGALSLAAQRLGQVRGQVARLAAQPRIGTRHEETAPGLRHVTFDRMTYWFALDDARRTVRVLGIFHGGQDHFARMMRRLGAGGD